MSLAQHIARQRTYLETLIALLETERESLAHGQVDGQRLSQLAKDKQQAIAQLEQLESQRLSAQRKLGYGEGRLGAERAAQDAGCTQDWQAFRERAQHAKQLNQLNGVLVGSRLTQNQRILDFLNEAAGKSLYGPDGQSRRRGFGGVASSA
ncbi:flagella synthesis protein FlgN [Modicisalibacter xianhensis]|uniref:Flagella synthesis protein FlgN n=1 Tax=Modicisalibacter xianhensis TaxID=442341 RepID=A0A4R8FZ67_9GAMM|nr:flagellar protein FlgN [Halomonas xianhensis]TDX30960.1 flagella synthesis protein FlgN [Halomonas xianhensis]